MRWVPSTEPGPTWTPGARGPRPLGRLTQVALVALAVTAVAGFLAVWVVGLVASLRWLSG